MLQFILGTSGSGKTAYIYNQISEFVSQKDENVIMLVPDQSTFDAEKAFLDILGPRLSRRVGVFGFSGLCRHVFELKSAAADNVIDNGTKAVIMNVALEQLSEKLTLLKNGRGRAVGDMLLSTLSDCKAACVSTDMLRTAALSVENETLKTKLNETALVLDAYEAIVSRSYIDPLDDLTRLYNILLQNKELLSDSVLFMDSFSGFNAEQLRLVRLLISRCKNVFIALTLDPFSDGREQVFAVPQKTYKQLKAFARENFIDIKAPVKLGGQKRFRNSELSMLERGIFRKEPESSAQPAGGVLLYSAADIYDECEFAARRIKELVINEGWLYSDFSVIARDLTPYRAVLSAVFDKYEIPFFADNRKDIGLSPVIRFIECVFRLVLDNFQREDMLTLLKTRLSSNSAEDICEFENYIYIWSLNGSDFKREFTANPAGFSDSFSNSDKHRLDTVERVRKSIVGPLVRFKENASGKNGRELCELLYQLLVELDVPQNLGKMCDELELRLDRESGNEPVKVWALFIGALDKTLAVTADMPLSLKRFYELLSLQISSLEFSAIPQTVDCVDVTTAPRVRLPSCRAAFLIGCADGTFPLEPKVSGMFSAFELKLLALNEVKIRDGFSELADLETYLAYCCMTSPSELLFASYPRVDSGGEKRVCSQIFEEIKRVFPDVSLLDCSDFDSSADSMLAVRPAFEEYARSLGGGSALRGLDSYFENDREFEQKAQAVRRAVQSAPFVITDQKNAGMLFGQNLRISASQIEKFSLCRFYYFCNYGLRVRERRKAEINPMEYGTLVHYVLEVFFSKYSKKEYSMLTDDELLKFIEDKIEEYLNSYFGGSQSKSGAFIYRLNVICKNMLVLLRHIIAELSQSDFNVISCELNIGEDIPSYTLELPSGHKIAVCGSVDRVDMMKDGDVRYIRVIDYKTGTKKFRLSDILYGLNLQMLLYLHSIQENGGKKFGGTVPAGILYMPATPPSFNADGMDDFEIEAKINSELKMNGLLLDDVKVIEGMDKTEKGRYIPVKIVGGEPSSASSLASLEQFGMIFRKLDETVLEMGKMIYDGDVQAQPLKGAHDACEYCPYTSVCAYNMSPPVNAFTTDNQKVYEMLFKEQGGEE